MTLWGQDAVMKQPASSSQAIAMGAPPQSAGTTPSAKDRVGHFHSQILPAFDAATKCLDVCEFIQPLCQSVISAIRADPKRIGLIAATRDRKGRVRHTQGRPNKRMRERVTQSMYQGSITMFADHLAILGPAYRRLSDSIGPVATELDAMYPLGATISFWGTAAGTSIEAARDLAHRLLMHGPLRGVADLAFVGTPLPPDLPRHLRENLMTESHERLERVMAGVPDLSQDGRRIRVCLNRDRWRLWQVYHPRREAPDSGRLVPPADGLPAITHINCRDRLIRIHGETIELTAKRFDLFMRILNGNGGMVKLHPAAHKYLNGLDPRVGSLMVKRAGKGGGRSIDPRHIAKDAIVP